MLGTAVRLIICSCFRKPFVNYEVSLRHMGTHFNINDHGDDKEYYRAYDKEQRQAGTVSLYRNWFRRAIGSRASGGLAEGE